MMREGAIFLLVAPFLIYIILIAYLYLRKLMLYPLIPGSPSPLRRLGSASAWTIRPNIG
jgi:hypothetical protein